MKNWVKKGLLWGAIGYVITMVLFPVIDGEDLSVTKLILGIPLWIIVGMALGYLIKGSKETAPAKSRKKKKR